MTQPVYCQPRFRRGTGFGNRLFYWARCRIYSNEHSAQMISPIWFRPAVGQLRRGGIDYMSYLKQIVLLRLFRRRDGDLSVARGWIVSLRATRFSETKIDEVPLSGNSGPYKLIFDEPEYSFLPLRGKSEFLHDELRCITRPRYLKQLKRIGDIPIAINIRCGNDFLEQPDDPEYTRVAWLQKTPLPWFCETLELIRMEAGWSVPAVVVSDGSKETLKQILSMENVVFLRPGNAITDLLSLSQAKVLLASASSTFSAWACFLGQMPTATAPGHPLTNWGIESEKGQYIGDFNPRTPSPKFLAQAVSRLKQ